jgi:hypothetical protein
MTNKMKLLIGLLVLGIVLLGGGMVFLFLPRHQTETRIILTTSPGSYLFNSQNESSGVLLQTVKMEKSVSDKYFGSIHPEIDSVNTGDPILIVSGTVQNNHPANTWINMYAIGYDAAGKQVALTLDASNLVGLILLNLKSGETGTFTLHLNYTENVKSIRIFASNYDQVPP